MSTQDQRVLDVERLAETVDLECKAAQGRDGQGELPHDFWKTYSAMANTDGGVILLGVQEKPVGRFRILGLKSVDKVRKALWDNLNNRKQVNINLLGNDDVQPTEVQGHTILKVRVPRAPREQRPVYLGTNPLDGTYLRLHEGDYPADHERVKRMMAENVSTPRDDQILPNMGIELLDPEAVARYQQAFAVYKPGHVWAGLPTRDFLQQIGAYGQNWADGTQGLRLAGLLMFGRAEIIRDVLPYYMVDYQEHSGLDENERWSDRLIPDGTWSGNLYDFFSRVYRKLITDLKVPFRLQGAQRVDDTPAHEALREALVNTLIHADFHAPAPILVIKRPDSFSFRNPGRMRVSIELARHGGLSDCRNRRLQTMFQQVGFGDLAGSGVPKIFTRWASQHWVRPLLQEDLAHELTTLELRMISLMPSEVESRLQTLFGSRFQTLEEDARLALITAATEGMVNNRRLREICTRHRVDIGTMLSRLVKAGYLRQEGAGRGTCYRLAEGQTQHTDDLFEQLPPATPKPDNHRNSTETTGVEAPNHRSKPSEPPEYTAETTGVASSNHRNSTETTGVEAPNHRSKPSEPPEYTAETTGVASSNHRSSTETTGVNERTAPEYSQNASEMIISPAPSPYLDWDAVPSNQQGRLQALAAPVAQEKRVASNQLQAVILALCDGHFLGLQVLSFLLKRDPDDLRKRTLSPMVKAGLLRPAYPATHAPRQAYTRATPSSRSLT